MSTNSKLSVLFTMWSLIHLHLFFLSMFYMPFQIQLKCPCFMKPQFIQPRVSLLSPEYVCEREREKGAGRDRERHTLSLVPLCCLVHAYFLYKKLSSLKGGLMSKMLSFLQPLLKYLVMSKGFHLLHPLYQNVAIVRVMLCENLNSCLDSVG